MSRIFLYFFVRYAQQEIGEMYGRCRSTVWHHIHSALQMLQKKWRYFYIGNSKLILDETIGQATSGDPEAVDEVLRHYSIFSSTICCGPPGNYQAGRFFDKLEQGLNPWGLSSL